MLNNGGLELPKPPLQIKEGDKFYCRLLSKESSLAQHSFQVYYGVKPGAVPFQWESQPGTPKHPAAAGEELRPPLSPPPSYYYSKSKSKSSSKKQSSGQSLIRIFLLQLSLLRKPASLSWSSSSSSSPSCSISNGAAHHRRLSSWSWSSNCSYRTDEEECSSLDDGSPTSILCFGGGRGRLRSY